MSYLVEKIRTVVQIMLDIYGTFEFFNVVSVYDPNIDCRGC